MEIINIEARTFEAMMTRFESFAERVDALCRANGEKTLQEWLDNQDVCRTFNLSLRTLQSGGGGFCQNLNRIVRRRGDRSRCRTDAGNRRPRYGCESGGRYPRSGDGIGHDQGRRKPDWHVGGPQHRPTNRSR